MRKYELGTITNGTEVEIDLRSVSSPEAMAALEGKDVVIVMSSVGVTGTVTLQEDRTGNEGDARAYTTVTDDQGNNVVSIADGVVMFNARMSRFMQLLTTVSAGTVYIYALDS